MFCDARDTCLQEFSELFKLIKYFDIIVKRNMKTLTPNPYLGIISELFFLCIFFEASYITEIIQQPNQILIHICSFPWPFFSFIFISGRLALRHIFALMSFLGNSKGFIFLTEMTANNSIVSFLIVCILNR